MAWMIDDKPIQDSIVSSTTNRSFMLSRGLKRKLSWEDDEDQLNGAIALEYLQIRLMDQWYDWHYTNELYHDVDTICPCPMVQCPQIGSSSTRKFKLPCFNARLTAETFDEIPICHDNLCTFIICCNDPWYDSFIFLI